MFTFINNSCSIHENVYTNFTFMVKNRFSFKLLICNCAALCPRLFQFSDMITATVHSFLKFLNILN